MWTSTDTRGKDKYVFFQGKEIIIMFQKIQKKIREFIKEKGQGTVEYALIIGFVAIIAVYMLTGSGLTSNAKANIDNANQVATDIDSQFDAASKVKS